ncbi:MAG: R3H domain-containing nucleic acid-binding protein [Geitlerinemataceae cyanobacterium]
MNDPKLQRGREWLEKLLGLGGLAVQVTASWEIDSCWLTIDNSNLTPEQISTLIGDRGETIDAIQYLANSILNIERPPEEQSAYTIELDGYRARRQDELRSLASEVTHRVRSSGEQVEMTSLSAAERRQIHTFLKEETDLETESRGEEPDRRLVIRLHRSKL